MDKTQCQFSACRGFVSWQLSGNGQAVLVIVVFVFVSASAWAQQAPIEYKLSFPAPEHRWMQVEVRFPERAGRHAAGADGAHLAGPLRAPRVCEERLRRVDRERQGPAAHRDASRSASMGLRRPRRHGRRHLQDLRRSHRRHVSRHRRHARAHQHSGGADVRARLVRAAGARHVRAAARQEVEGRHAAVSDQPIRSSSPRRTSIT